MKKRQTDRLLAALMTLALSLSLLALPAGAEEPAADPAPGETAALAEAPGSDGAGEELAVDTAARTYDAGGSLDNGTWSLSSDNTTLTFTGSGAIPDYGGTSLTRPPWYPYRGTITKVSISAGYTSLGSYALSGLTEITSLTIPSGMTSLGAYAVSGCSSLKTVQFNSASSGSAIALGTGVFQDCTSLTGITGGARIASLGTYAFRNCVSLESFPHPGDYAVVGTGAFQNCGGLASVRLPEGLEEIASDAFRGCTSLTELIIPEGCYVIRANAFDGSGLKTVCLPGSLYGTHGGGYLNYINANAFRQCGSLEKVYWGGTPEQWQAMVAAGASGWSGSLESGAIYHDGNEALLSAALYPRTTAGTCGPDLTWIMDGDGVLRIYGSGEMYNTWGSASMTPWGSRMAELTAVDLPEGLTVVGGHAFQGAAGLAVLRLPFGVTEVGESAFQGCASLGDVLLPSSLTRVGAGAFSGCAGLEHVYYSGTAGGWAALAGSSAEIRAISGVPRSSGCDYGSYTETGGVEWVLDGAGLILLGSGTMPDANSPVSVPWNDHLTGVTSVTVRPGIRNIGDYAFWSFNGAALTSVTLPGTVERIGRRAFFNCDGLTSVVIPEGVTEIVQEAFQESGNLTEIGLPSTLTDVGYGAFYKCSGLTDVYYGGGAAAWDQIRIQGLNAPLTGAALHFAASVSITAQPQDVTVAKAGDKAVFTIAAQGADDLTYAWYYRNLGASKWTKSSITGPKFTLIISQDREVKCEVTGGGTTVTSAVAKGLVPDNTVLNLLPDATQVANPSDKVSFQVTGGTAPYTWYYRNDGASKWSKSAVTGNKFSLVVSKDREAYCVSADGKQSAIATATIAELGNIQVTPATAVAAKAGGRVTFTATGGSGPYAWYYRNAGALTWTKSSVTTNKFPILVGKDREVFCACGDARSPVVTATVGK